MLHARPTTRHACTWPHTCSMRTCPTHATALSRESHAAAQHSSQHRTPPAGGRATHHAIAHHLPHLGGLQVAHHQHAPALHLLHWHKLDQAADDLQRGSAGAGQGQQPPGAANGTPAAPQRAQHTLQACSCRCSAPYRTKAWQHAAALHAKTAARCILPQLYSHSCSPSPPQKCASLPLTWRGFSSPRSISSRYSDSALGCCCTLTI
jgi:hypothetical protein